MCCSPARPSICGVRPANLQTACLHSSQQRITILTKRLTKWCPEHAHKSSNQPVIIVFSLFTICPLCVCVKSVGHIRVKPFIAGVIIFWYLNIFYNLDLGKNQESDFSVSTYLVFSRVDWSDNNAMSSIWVNKLIFQVLYAISHENWLSKLALVLNSVMPVSCIWSCNITRWTIYIDNLFSITLYSI
mgnify:CR=1 FL=1